MNQSYTMESDNHRECVHLVKDLDAPVKHIILTTHAYEHKIFISPFQRRFPEAQVYVVPKCVLLPCSTFAAAQTPLANAQPVTTRRSALHTVQDTSMKLLYSTS